MTGLANNLPRGAEEAASTGIDTESYPGLLSPGHNCWRIEHARRLAVLIDGAACFSAFRAAAARARRSLMLIGWDIDRRTQLAPDGTDDGLPGTLGEFLNALVRRRRELRTYGRPRSSDPLVASLQAAAGAEAVKLCASLRSEHHAQPVLAP